MHRCRENCSEYDFDKIADSNRISHSCYVVLIYALVENNNSVSGFTISVRLYRKLIYNLSSISLRPYRKLVYNLTS